MPSPSKITHQEAAYREQGLIARHCAICSMFRDRKTERCTLVEDPIEWYGVCKHFERKSK